MNIRCLMLVMASVALTACVSVPADRGAARSVELLKSRSTVAAAVHLGEANPAALPDQPLDADACVRVALNRSPSMQMQYAQLGLQQADVYDATRLSNPSLSFMHADVQASDATRSTWGLSQNFTELLFINYRSKLGRSIQLQAQQQVAAAVLNLEAEVRTAYYRYVVASLVAGSTMREATNPCWPQECGRST